MSENSLVSLDIYETESGIINDFGKLVQPTLSATSDTNIKYECNDSKQLKTVLNNIVERDKLLNENLTEVVNGNLKNSQKELYQEIQESKLQEQPNEDNLRLTTENISKSNGEHFPPEKPKSSSEKLENCSQISSILEKSVIPNLNKHFKESNSNNFQNDISTPVKDSVGQNMGNHSSKNLSNDDIDYFENFDIAKNDNSTEKDLVQKSGQGDVEESLISEKPVESENENDKKLLSNKDQNSENSIPTDIDIISDKGDDDVLIVEESEAKIEECITIDDDVILEETEKDVANHNDISKDVNKNKENANFIESIPGCLKIDEDVVIIDEEEVQTPENKNIIVIDLGSEKDDDDVVIKEQYPRKDEDKLQSATKSSFLGNKEKQTSNNVINDEVVTADNQEVILIEESPEKRIETTIEKNKDIDSNRTKKRLYFELRKQELVLVEEHSQSSETNNILENKLKNDSDNSTSKCDFSFLSAYKELTNSLSISNIKNEKNLEDTGSKTKEEVQISEKKNRKILEIDHSLVDSSESIANIKFLPSSFENLSQQLSINTKKNDSIDEISINDKDIEKKSPNGKSHQEGVNNVSKSTEMQIVDLKNISKEVGQDRSVTILNYEVNVRDQKIEKTFQNNISNEESLQLASETQIQRLNQKSNATSQTSCETSQKDEVLDQDLEIITLSRISNEESLKMVSSETHIQENQKTEEINISGYETSTENLAMLPDSKEDKIKISTQSDNAKMTTDNKSENTEDIAQNVDRQDVNLVKFEKSNIDFSFITAYTSLQNENQNILMEKSKISSKNLEDEFCTDNDELLKKGENNSSENECHEESKSQTSFNINLEASINTVLKQQPSVEAPKEEITSTSPENTSHEIISSSDEKNLQHPDSENKIIEVLAQIPSGTSIEPQIEKETANKKQENSVSLDKIIEVSEENVSDIATSSEMEVELTNKEKEVSQNKSLDDKREISEDTSNLLNDEETTNTNENDISLETNSKVGIESMKDQMCMDTEKNDQLNITIDSTFEDTPRKEETNQIIEENIDDTKKIDESKPQTNVENNVHEENLLVKTPSSETNEKLIVTAEEICMDPDRTLKVTFRSDCTNLNCEENVNESIKLESRANLNKETSVPCDETIGSKILSDQHEIEITTTPEPVEEHNINVDNPIKETSRSEHDSQNYTENINVFNKVDKSCSQVSEETVKKSEDIQSDTIPNEISKDQKLETKEESILNSEEICLSIEKNDDKTNIPLKNAHRCEELNENLQENVTQSKKVEESSKEVNDKTSIDKTSKDDSILNEKTIVDQNATQDDNVMKSNEKIDQSLLVPINEEEIRPVETVKIVDQFRNDVQDSLIEDKVNSNEVKIKDLLLIIEKDNCSTQETNQTENGNNVIITEVDNKIISNQIVRLQEVLDNNDKNNKPSNNREDQENTEIKVPNEEKIKVQESPIEIEDSQIIQNETTYDEKVIEVQNEVHSIQIEDQSKSTEPLDIEKSIQEDLNSEQQETNSANCQSETEEVRNIQINVANADRMEIVEESSQVNVEVECNPEEAQSDHNDILNQTNEIKMANETQNPKDKNSLTENTNKPNVENEIANTEIDKNKELKIANVISSSSNETPKDVKQNAVPNNLRESQTAECEIADVKDTKQQNENSVQVSELESSKTVHYYPIKDQDPNVNSEITRDNQKEFQATSKEDSSDINEIQVTEEKQNSFNRKDTELTPIEILTPEMKKRSEIYKDNENLLKYDSPSCETTLSKVTESSEDQTKGIKKYSNEVENTNVKDVLDTHGSNETKLQINYQIQLKANKNTKHSNENQNLLSVEAEIQKTCSETEQHKIEKDVNQRDIAKEDLTKREENQKEEGEHNEKENVRGLQGNQNNKSEEICEPKENHKPLTIELETESDQISPQESPKSPIMAPLFTSYTPNDDLRNKIKMQLNLLRTVKKVPNKDEPLPAVCNEIKPNSNLEKIEKPHLNDVLISNESEHLIISVVGGYVSDDDSNITNGSENSTKEKLNNSNMSITDFLLQKNTQSLGDKSPNKNSITPQKTKDITKIKGWRSKHFTLDEHFDENHDDIDITEHHPEPPLEEPTESIPSSLNLDQPSTSKGVLNKAEASEEQTSSEIVGPVEKLPRTIKSAFVSDVLDSFLSNDAKLQISYEIPKLKAEEAITHPTELPVLPCPEPEKIETEKPVKKIEVTGYKPKTLAEKRKLLEMERKKKLSQKMVINENYIEKLKRAKSDQNVIDHFVKENFPFSKNSWDLATKNSPFQYAMVNNEKIKIMGGYGKSFHINNTYKEPNTRRFIPRTIEKRKAGPLSFKLKQLNANKRNYEYKVLTMPKIKLVIYPECGKKLPYIAEQYLSLCKDDTCISENFALFAVSALTTVTEPQRLEFELPYANNQNNILLKKIYAEEKKEEDVTIETKMIKIDRYPNVTVDQEIKNVVSDMIDCIENQDLDKNLIKDDPDFEPRKIKDEKPKNEVHDKQKGEEDLLQSAIIKQRNHKKSKTTLELRRLNIQIIEVDVEDSPKNDKTECTEEFCRLGCVCASLSGVGNSITDHCGRENCMFKCTCTDIPQQNKHSVKLPAGTDLLSASTMLRLKDDALKHLAKVEKEFTQTVIKANNQTIVVGGGCRERQKRVPKVPKKFDDYIPAEDLVKNLNNLPPETKENIKVEKKEEVSTTNGNKPVPATNKKTLIPIWKTEKTFEEKLIEKAKNSKCTVSLQKLDLSNILPFCMVHNLYKCYCGGMAEKQTQIRPQSSQNTNGNGNMSYITYSSGSRKVAKDMSTDPRHCARTRMVQAVQEVDKVKINEEKLIFDKNNRKPETRNSKKRLSLDLEGNELLVPRQSTRIMRKKERISYAQDDDISEDIEDVPLKTRLRTSDKAIRGESPEIQSGKRKSVDSIKADEPSPIRRSSREIKVTSKVDKNNPFGAKKPKITLKNDENATNTTIRVRNDLIENSSQVKDVLPKPNSGLSPKDRVSSLIDYEKSYTGLIIPTDEWKITFQKMLKLAPTTFTCIRLIQWPMLVERYQKKEIQVWISCKNIFSNVILTENKKRPSRFHLNIQGLHDMIVDNTKVPNIVNCLLNNKIPGNSQKGNETYMILVNTGLDWEARGTILLNNIENLIKERLRHRPAPKYLLVDAFKDTQKPQTVVVYNENKLNSEFMETENIMETESKKRKSLDEQKIEEQNKKLKTYKALVEKNKKSDLATRDEEPTTNKITPIKISLMNKNLARKYEIVPQKLDDVSQKQVTLKQEITPQKQEILRKQEVTPRKQEIPLQKQEFSPDIDVVLQSFRPILPKKEKPSQNFLFGSQERKNEDPNIVYSSNSMTIEKVNPDPPKILKDPLSTNTSENSDETQFTKILASLPTGTDQFHWFMLKLENDFSVLKITSTNFYIKYMHLISAVQMAYKNQKTVRIRTLDKEQKHHLSYGIYAVADYNDRIFFGPYLTENEHFLETYRYANGKLISTKAYNLMRGYPNKEISGIWFTRKMDPNKIMKSEVPTKIEVQERKKEDVVDLTENDSDEEKEKINKSKSSDPLFNILSANFTKQLANDVTIEKITKTTEKLDLSISDTITSVNKGDIRAAKTGVTSSSSSSSSSVRKDVTPPSKQSKSVIDLDSSPEEPKVARKRKLLDHLQPKSSTKQLPPLIPVTTLQTSKKLDKNNLTEQSPPKLTSILKPMNVFYLTSNIPGLGYFDVLYSDDSFQFPGIPIEDNGTRKFENMNDAMKWLSSFLKQHICHVPAELDLVFSVWKYNKPPNISKFNDQYLNGLYLICSRGIFNIYHVKADILKAKGFPSTEIADMLFYKFNILIQKNIRILGNILFDNDADGIEDYEILAMAPQKIRELTTLEENLVLRKKKLLEEQKSKIVMLEQLTNGLPEPEKERITTDLGIILAKQHPQFNVPKKSNAKPVLSDKNSGGGLKFKLMSKSNKTYFVPINSDTSNNTNVSNKSDASYLSSDNSEIVDLTDS